MAIFLVLFGLMSIYSIETAVSNPDFLNFKKQLIFSAIGLIFLIFFSVFDYRYLKNYAVVLFIIGLLILAGVLIGGSTVRGTKGWILIFGAQGFQPVEVIKIILIATLGKYFSDWRAEIKNLKQLGITLGIGGLFIGLVVLQPDFGSAIILTIIFLGMLLIVKTKKQYLAAIFFLLCLVMVVSWFFVLHDFQKERILNFMDPARDPYGTGYNIKQSIIAVGSGNIFGRGLSLGSQSRLNFLPAQETDFIFAVIAEELGLVGITLLLVFFVIIFYRLIKIVRLARDDFGRFLISGIIIYFFAQTVLNIGMNIGILPIAGVPLPLVSYGGSSLIATLMAIGIAQSVHIRHKSAL
jgi:rod shape determining protein RodA